MTSQNNEPVRLGSLRALGAGEPVLSVYLPLEPGASPHRVQSARLLELFKPLREGLSGENLERFNAEAERVLSYVRDESQPAGGLTLAVFASEPRGLFSVERLDVRLPGIARFEDAPYLIPLEAALENSPTVTVALIDERQARLITARLAEVVDKDRVVGHVPNRQRQGGYSESRYERDRARHVDEHVKNVAAQMEKQHREDGVKRFVIAGAPETTSALQKALSKEMQPLVAGVAVVEMYATDADVLEKALPVALAAERDEEMRLVDEIRDKVASRGAASLGWDQTMPLLEEGRVHRLAIGVGHMGTEQGDRAVEAAWRGGAGVEFLQDEAEAALADVGGIGALLRY